jgi:hypothetical protein
MRMTTFPVALQKYATISSAPLLINACEVDPQFPEEKQAKAHEIFKSFEPGFKQAYFEGCTHGFAVRGNMVGVFVLALAEVVDAAAERSQGQGGEGGLISEHGRVVQKVPLGAYGLDSCKCNHVSLSYHTCQ